MDVRAAFLSLLLPPHFNQAQSRWIAVTQWFVSAPPSPPSNGSHVKCAEVNVKAKKEERRAKLLPISNVVQLCFMEVGWHQSWGGWEARPFKSPPQPLGQVGQMEVVPLIHYTESDVTLTLTGLPRIRTFFFFNAKAGKCGFLFASCHHHISTTNFWFGLTWYNSFTSNTILIFQPTPISI